MTDMELFYFHKNFKYMWDKLSTSYYQVKRKLDKANRVVGGEILPAYSICSKCFNDGEYTPSKNAVDSIVQLYNLNLSPKIDTYQFLHEDLSDNDRNRFRNTDLFDKRFIGHYLGYYPSASLNGRTVGAYLRIFEADSLLRAVLVTGIRNDEELSHPALRAIFQKEPPQYSDFTDYYRGRTSDNQRCYYYEGLVEVSNSSLLIVFRGADEDRRKLVLTLNLECFPAGVKRSYHGGLAYMLATSDGPFDTRFFKMGLINTEHGFVSMETEGISELLLIEEKGNSASLTSTEDRDWYEFILTLIERRTKGKENVT